MLICPPLQLSNRLICTCTCCTELEVMCIKCIKCTITLLMTTTTEHHQCNSLRKQTRPVSDHECGISLVWDMSVNKYMLYSYMQLCKKNSAFTKTLQYATIKLTTGQQLVYRLLIWQRLRIVRKFKKCSSVN